VQVDVQVDDGEHERAQAAATLRNAAAAASLHHASNLGNERLHFLAPFRVHQYRRDPDVSAGVVGPGLAIITSAQPIGFDEQGGGIHRTGCPQLPFELAGDAFRQLAQRDGLTSIRARLPACGGAHTDFRS
jgi:hypothetical protein